MSPQFQKAQIAESFSRAAGSYDAVAELQRRIGHQVLQQIPVAEGGVILDLGSGTGYFSEQLSQRCHPDHLICLDLAQGMLDYASRHRPTQSTSWICGDAENIPLADGSVDLIFSSLAIQWCENLSSLFSEVSRVLKPGGRFVFSTLGPETLYELRQSWSAVDQYEHVNRFISFDTLSDYAGRYLRPCSLTQQPELLLYGQLRELTSELKGIGAHNINAGRQQGLTGKARVTAFREAYETFRRQDGQLPATYQVFYGDYVNG